LFFRTAFENAPFFSYYAEDDAPNGAKCNALNRDFLSAANLDVCTILFRKVRKSNGYLNTFADNGKVLCFFLFRQNTN